MELKQLRKRELMTQTDLAVRCGCSQKMISAIEQKVRQPSPSLAHRIGTVLNLTKSQIWDMFYEREGTSDAGTEDDAGEGCRRVSGDQS